MSVRPYPLFLFFKRHFLCCDGDEIFEIQQGSRERQVTSKCKQNKTKQKTTATTGTRTSDDKVVTSHGLRGPGFSRL